MNCHVFFAFIILSLCSSVSAKNQDSSVNLVNRLSLAGWKTVMLRDVGPHHNVMSIKADLSQVVILKHTKEWKKEFAPHVWHDSEKGSFLFLPQEEMGVYLLDLNLQKIPSSTKEHVLKLLSSDQHGSTTSHQVPRRGFSFFSEAHAEEECQIQGGMDETVRDLESFSAEFISNTLPVDALEVFRKLQTCLATSFQEMGRDLQSMGNDPQAYLNQTWDKVAGLVEFAKQFTTLAPQLFEGLKNIPQSEYKNILWTVICPMAAKIIATTAVTGGAILAATILKELEIVKKVLLHAGKVIAHYKVLALLQAHYRDMPSFKPLTVHNGRQILGSPEKQAKYLASWKNGKMLVNGEELDPASFYSGVILSDGRMLIIKTAVGNHNDLPLISDKVVTAFEIVTGKKGVIGLMRNQSGTFRPDFEEGKDLLLWWSRYQNILNGGTDAVSAIPFKYTRYIP